MTYDAAVAFVDGYNAATSGGVITGFREWLIVALGEGSNLVWSGLVRALMKRTSTSIVEGDDEAEIEFMFSTLEKFLREREEPEGMRRIYLRYEAWLQAQDWYTPSSPAWISRTHR